MSLQHLHAGAERQAVEKRNGPNACTHTAAGDAMGSLTSTQAGAHDIHSSEHASLVTRGIPRESRLLKPETIITLATGLTYDMQHLICRDVSVGSSQ